MNVPDLTTNEKWSSENVLFKGKKICLKNAVIAFEKTSCIQYEDEKRPRILFCFLQYYSYQWLKLHLQISSVAVVPFNYSVVVVVVGDAAVSAHRCAMPDRAANICAI